MNLDPGLHFKAFLSSTLAGSLLRTLHCILPPSIERDPVALKALVSGSAEDFKARVKLINKKEL